MPAAAVYPRRMDPRWRDGVGPSGPSLNHPEYKSTWRRQFQRRYPSWEWGIVLSLAIFVPATVQATGSLAWGFGVSFAGSGLIILARYLVRRRQRSARSKRREHDSLPSTPQTVTNQSLYSLHDERDRLAAENARLKARLRRVEHGD